MTYRLIIFDFDGVLADSAAWAAKAINEMAPRHGYRQVDDAELQELRGCTAREVMRRLGVPAWRLPFLAREMRARMAADVEAIHCFPGARDLLQRLAQAGYALAIVSSNAEDNIRRILGPDATGAVAAFACGAGLFGKARKFRAVMRRLNASPAETLCIGDELRDIEAARTVGASAGAVAWGYATPAILAAQRPDHMFAAPLDVEQLLAG